MIIKICVYTYSGFFTCQTAKIRILDICKVVIRTGNCTVLRNICSILNLRNLILSYKNSTYTKISRGHLYFIELMKMKINQFVKIDNIDFLKKS